MHSLIVLAHPEEDSFSHAVAEQVIAGLQEDATNSYELADLVAENFEPRFSKSDYEVFRNEAAPPADVVAEQARLDRADALIMIFPVFWWSMPAILKGWIDRVFLQNWAFKDDGGEHTVGLLGRLAIQTIAIGGATERTYKRRGYRQAMRTQIDQGVFGYVGARMVGSELLLPLDASSSKRGLNRAREIGKNLSSTVQEAK